MYGLHTLTGRAFLHALRALIRDPGDAALRTRLRKLLVQEEALKKMKPERISGSSVFFKDLSGLAEKKARGQAPTHEYTTELMESSAAGYADLPEDMQAHYRARARAMV